MRRTARVIVFRPRNGAYLPRPARCWIVVNPAAMRRLERRLLSPGQCACVALAVAFLVYLAVQLVRAKLGGAL